jgi:tRNA1(Val) A37 N6-methylase TrmN6
MALIEKEIANNLGFTNKDFKFSYCISNPPYQIAQKSNVVNDTRSTASCIFDDFFLLGNKIADVNTMIFPAK